MSRAESLTRLSAAQGFVDVAEREFDSSGRAPESETRNAVVAANAVLGGLAAADAMCGFRRGERSNSSDHRAAVDLLRVAIRDSAPVAHALNRLLSMKNDSQYGVGVSRGTATSAVRLARQLLDRAIEESSR